MKEIPYLLTTLIAHCLVLELDNRRSIKISDLINFRHLLLEKYLEEYQKYGDGVIGEKWEGDLKFAPVNDLIEIKKLLQEYPEVFYFQNGSIWIHENIDLSYLYKLKKDEFPNIYDKFHDVTNLKKVRNSLAITKIYELGDIVNKKLENIESQLEKAYSDLDNSQQLIKPLLMKKFLFLNNIVTNFPILINQFNIINYSDENLVIRITEDYDYLAKSTYTKNNEKYPIDNQLYKISNFYENVAWLCNPIQGIIEDTYQYAIFGNFNLYKHKIYEIFAQYSFAYLLSNINKSDNNFDIDIDEILNNDEIDNNNNNGYAILNNNAIEEEFIFWLTYIHKINEYLANNYDENLVKVKNRLLYLLDDVSKCLYIDENFEKIFEQAMEKLEELKAEYEEKELDEEDYYDEEDEEFDEEYEQDDDDDKIYGYLGKEAKYLIYDCFLGREYKIVEKLLLISTYYSLTNNEKIVEILNQFENSPKYSEYKNIIIGQNYEKVLQK